ncbi:hypothetical protein LWC33_13670 [Pseudonocardia sp. RS11V-5]|uniref:hypothetical protein n=1 Tax=Pseudonocardia terrae TaxID=2905831 RepID=UPI001E2A6E9B|nr:hypothetical protein [Pseudonocardia terrae]MCE3552505.1 hypothetical protein [Pseudonocardia terrae]
MTESHDDRTPGDDPVRPFPEQEDPEALDSDPAEVPRPGAPSMPMEPGEEHGREHGED